MSSCCPTEDHDKKPKKKKFDFIMYGSLAIIVPVILLHLSNAPLPYIHTFGSSLIELFSTMWWGIALGLITVGLMNKIPREYFTHLMGRGDTTKDIIKASIAGVILDLCNHGILVMAGKLYERGLSTAQVLTFLVASPWNSLSLTFILIALIGWWWTLIFTLASMVIAIITGIIYIKLTKNGVLPENPNTVDVPKDFNIKKDAKEKLKGWRPNKAWFKDIARDGWHDGQMIIRWILFGGLIAAAMNAFVPPEIFQAYFGPTIIGLSLTLIAATIIEVCSEGSAPIAAEIMNSASAPGNGFTFLMAGVATDYTEILVIREFTKSWKIALTLPLITVPQILLIAICLNAY